jgi:hypothetical protein
MFVLNSRVVRRPLALSVTTLATVAALALLTGCADEPVGPTPTRPNPTASVQPTGDYDEVFLTVTNASGGTEVGSIRWAASQMTRPANWVILFDPRLGGDTITLGAELNLAYSARIEAPQEGITLSGNDQHRVIRAAAGLALGNVTVTRGNSGGGSAMYVGGSLVMGHTTVQDNRGAGPVIDADGLWVMVSNSTISRNVGTGALEYRDGSQVSLWHTTIAFNTGPGLSYDDGTRTLTKVELNNSIIANNTPENCTDNWHFQYLGTNISSDWSCGEVYIVVTDPQLKPLAYNGGPNMTHAIPHTSPAFNAATGDCVGEDQRYVHRGEKCDVGAFEFNDFTKVAITIDNAVKVNAATGKAMLTGTIKCTRAEAFGLHLELHQDQKINGEIVDVHSVSALPVQCGATAKAWSVPMSLLPGEAFQAGAAKAIVQTSNIGMPEWVAPASVTSGVRISLSRK